MEKDDKAEVERQRELERIRNEQTFVMDNRHERRRQAKFAKLRAKRAVNLMRAQGIDFIHDKF